MDIVLMSLTICCLVFSWTLSKAFKVFAGRLNEQEKRLSCLNAEILVLTQKVTLAGEAADSGAAYESIG